MGEKFAEVFPDVDSGGWWILCKGPVSLKLPRWVPPAKEVMDSICFAINDAYEKGLGGNMENDTLVCNVCGGPHRFHTTNVSANFPVELMGTLRAIVDCNIPNEAPDNYLVSVKAGHLRQLKKWVEALSESPAPK